MFSKNKKSNHSFFEKLTGVGRDESRASMYSKNTEPHGRGRQTEVEIPEVDELSAFQEEELDGELAVDVYETDTDIFIHTMTAGVRPEDVSISITPEMVTISGRRESEKNISDENFIHRELYFGSFSRTIELPKQIDPDLADAIEKHGLLIIRLPKLDKDKKFRLKVKSM